MPIARGLALTYTQGRSITGLPDGFRFVGTGSLGPVPMPIIIATLTFILGYILLTRTRVGEYVVAGLLSALAGMILIARLNSAQPTGGLGFEFDAIAAVVVGGTSCAGGEGGLGGTL